MKSALKAVKDAIKTLVFDLEQVKEVSINEDESHMIFVGNIKEKPMIDKIFSDYTWINNKRIDEYNMEEYEKEILKDILK